MRILHREEFPTKGKKWQEVLAEFGKRIDRFLTSGQEAASTLNVANVGISCGGPLDSKTGVIMSPPNLPGWDDVPVLKFFADRYGVPVHLQNDANACAYAAVAVPETETYKVQELHLPVYHALCTAVEDELF